MKTVRVFLDLTIKEAGCLSLCIDNGYGHGDLEEITRATGDTATLRRAINKFDRAYGRALIKQGDLEE